MRYFHLVKVFVQQVKILSGFIPRKCLHIVMKISVLVTDCSILLSIIKIF